MIIKKIAYVLALAVLAGTPFAAGAKTTQWSETITGDFYYYFNFLREDGKFGYRAGHPERALFDGNAQGGTPSSGSWTKGLVNPNVTVTYAATLINTDTGTPINDGASVPIGTHIQIASVPHTTNDIYWFGTGYTADSPYGKWGSGPPPLPRLEAVTFHHWTCLQRGPNGCTEPDIVVKEVPAYMPTCTAADYVGVGTSIGGGLLAQAKWPIYVPLWVAPPTKTISGTNVSGLTCQAATTDSSGTITQNCTVTGAGSFTPTVTFAPTTGNFYYRVDPNTTGERTESEAEYAYWADSSDGSVCFGNNIPMRLGMGGPTYNLPVDQEAISFSFTAEAENRTPTTPSIGGPTTGTTCSVNTFTFTATDPDGDQIRYGIDWDNNSVADQWLPASGYVTSGTSQTASRTWTTPGTYSFKVLAQDAMGASSAWVTKTIVISACPAAPTATLTASPNPVTTSGGTSTLSWSCSGNTTSASINQGIGTLTGTSGASWSGTKPSGAITATKTFLLTCTGPGGTTTDDVTVTLNTALPDLNASTVAPSTATVNVAQTYSSNVRNIGNANTNAAFTAKIQQASDASGTGAADKGSVSLAPIAPATQRAASYSLTFASAGTVYLRVCADSTGEITESLENNNCSAWTPVTVAPGPASDLTASAVTPTTATVNVAQTYSATVPNTGDANTNASFVAKIQQATDAAGTGAVDKGTVTLAAIAADTQRVASYSLTFASISTVYLRVCADSTSLIAESNEANNCGAWTPVTVAAPLPNLRASNVSGGTAPKVNIATTLSATITNAGAGSTVAGFSNLYQIDADTDHTTAVNYLRADTSPALAPSATDGSSISFAFPWEGTWYVRACADYNTSWVSAIPESDEGDNCSSDWVAITVVPVDDPDLSCSVSPANPAINQSVTFSASPSNLGSSAYTWDASNAAAVSGRPATYSVSFADAGTYQMKVSATDYDDGSCSVVVGANSCTAKDVTITAGADRVEKGQTTTLSWDIPGVADAVNTCTIKTSVDNSIIKSIDTTTCTENSSGTITSPPITGQTTFTLTCGTKTDTVVVSLIPGIDEF